MKRWHIIVSLVLVSLLVLLCYVWKSVTYNIKQYDMPIGEAFGAFLMDTTTWAPGFSDSKFMSISPGMTTNQVIQIIGPPLLRESDDYPDQLWFYTTGHDGARGGTSYCNGSTHGRLIAFDKNMHVVYKRKWFYFD
jgi:hypothetical protein